MNRVFYCLLLNLVLALASNKSYGQEQLVKVYRYYIPGQNNYVTTVEGEFDERTILAKGWTDKTLLFFAYSNSADNRIPIYSWYDSEKNRYLTAGADEFKNEKAMSAGYSRKKVLFYAPARKSENTIPVYRLLDKKNKYWISVIDRDSSIAKSGRFDHKTFQYFGLKR